MSIFLKLDGFDGSDTESYVPATLWLTEAVTEGDWIAVHYGDTTNPGGALGDSFRLADDGEVTYDVVGVAVQTTTGAGLYPVYIRGRVTANVDSAAAVAEGDPLSIGATAGRAIEYTGTNPALRVIGTCVSTPSANLATVEINPHPRFTSL